MIKRLAAFLAAFTLTLGAVPFSAGAENVDWDIITDEVTDTTTSGTGTGTTTTTTVTQIDTVSLEEYNRQREELQNQIDELKAMLEENGYSVNDNIDNINGEINSLQYSLDEIYSLVQGLDLSKLDELMSVQPLQANAESSGSSSNIVNSTPTVQQTSEQPTSEAQEKQSMTETTAVTTVTANTTPDAYLVEKADKKRA